MPPSSCFLEIPDNIPPSAYDLAKAADRSSPLKLPHGYQIYKQTKRQPKKVSYASIANEQFPMPLTPSYILTLGSNVKIKDGQSVRSRSRCFHHFTLHLRQFLLLFVLSAHLGRNISLALLHLYSCTILDGRRKHSSSERGCCCR
jgi:hypothetical protein